MRVGFGKGGTGEFDWDAAWDGAIIGLQQGIASLALNYATEALELNPLIANFGYAAIGGILEGTMNRLLGTTEQQNQTLFENIYSVYENNILTAFRGGNDPFSQAAYISQILDFSEKIREMGFVDAMNAYATGFMV